MKNFLFYFEYIIVAFVLGLCLLAAATIDVTIKILSALVYLFIYTIGTVFEILFKRKYNCKFIKKLYTLGGEWISLKCYPVINFIFKNE